MVDISNSNGMIQISNDGEIYKSYSSSVPMSYTFNRKNELDLIIDGQPYQIPIENLTIQGVHYATPAEAQPALDLVLSDGGGEGLLTPANPTGSVGLTVKNGSADTYMRSDAAPALDSTIITQTGEPSKLVQTDSGGEIIIQNSNNRSEYGPASIFMYGPNGNWIDIDASSMEIDLVGTGGNIHIGQDGIDTADKPITTSHAATQPNELVNKSLLDSTVQGSIKAVASDGKNAQVADINTPTFYAVPTSGMYRVSAFLVVSQAATTSSTLPGCSVSYTEATTGVVVQDIVTLSANTNTLGLHVGGSVIISAQQGSNIGYVTSNYASAGATPMQYAIHIKVEFLG